MKHSKKSATVLDRLRLISYFNENEKESFTLPHFLSQGRIWQIFPFDQWLDED